MASVHQERCLDGLAHLQIWNALVTLLTDLVNLHPVLPMYLLQCCGGDVFSTISISNMFYAHLMVYFLVKVVIEAAWLIAGEREGRLYTWTNHGLEHAIWEPNAMHWKFADLCNGAVMI